MRISKEAEILKKSLRRFGAGVADTLDLLMGDLTATKRAHRRQTIARTWHTTTPCKPHGSQPARQRALPHGMFITEAKWVHLVGTLKREQDAESYQTVIKAIVEYTSRI